MNRLEGSASAPNGFDGLLCDLYIDLNHVVGAGSVRLLEGRGAHSTVRDAWEFALTVAGAQASVPSGQRAQMARGAVFAYA